ncbi:Protein of unknown function, partial [Cotesia congregata]
SLCVLWRTEVQSGTKTLLASNGRGGLILSINVKLLMESLQEVEEMDDLGEFDNIFFKLLFCHEYRVFIAELISGELGESDKLEYPGLFGLFKLPELNTRVKRSLRLRRTGLRLNSLSFDSSLFKYP